MSRHTPRLSRRQILTGSAAAIVATTAPGATSTGTSSELPRYLETVKVAMRDGVHVAMSIWLPPGPGPFPVILMRSLDRRRYVKRLAMLDDLLAAGYAFVSSDVRGRFESEGEFDPTYGDKEGRDGYDTIEWLATQPWCNQRIGTYGLSHQSFYQVSTGKQHPPHLLAMATWTGGYRGDSKRPMENAHPPQSGGVTSLATLMIWLPNEAEAALDKLAAMGTDVTEARRVLRRMRTHPEETFSHLPLREAPITRYAGLRELFDYRMAREATPGGGAGTEVEQILVPVFHECGWYDPASWSQFQGFDALQRRAGNPHAREGQYMTAGPWQHGMVFQDRLGDMYFGLQSDNDGSGINKRQIEFFDKYVKGEDKSLAKVRYFLMGASEWRESEVWPPAHMVRQRLYLSSRHGANGVMGDGRLVVAAPTRERPDHFHYDPLHPVPTIGGSFSGTLNVPGMLPGPLEQSPIERRADVLVYTSEPMQHDVEISGPLVVNLFVATSAVDTDFTAKLCQVYADGRSYNIADAILRLSGRNLVGRKEPVKVDEIYEVRIGLGHTSLVLRKKESLRLQIASSNFPQYDRNMNTGNASGKDARGIVAQQTVHHAAAAASFIELPMAQIEL